MPNRNALSPDSSALHLESQHIAIKHNGRGHIEDLQQRRHPTYFNCHVIPLLDAYDIAPNTGYAKMNSRMVK